METWKRFGMLYNGPRGVRTFQDYAHNWEQFIEKFELLGFGGDWYEVVEAYMGGVKIPTPTTG